jgi:hypothetical protein
VIRAPHHSILGSIWADNNIAQNAPRKPSSYSHTSSHAPSLAVQRTKRAMFRHPPSSWFPPVDWIHLSNCDRSRLFAPSPTCQIANSHAAQSHLPYILCGKHFLGYERYVKRVRQLLVHSALESTVSPFTSRSPGRTSALAAYSYFELRETLSQPGFRIRDENGGESTVRRVAWRDLRVR